ncbi:MAG TPA: hypothetical protein VNL14_10890 [Candidatus Acidoferrales bacterium]|nr:hypothetical protein [Candidatus Acidoferrales bacterium]
MAANRISTAIGRAEIKDYTDLGFIGRARYRLEDYIPLARKKDAGVSRRMVAQLLSEFRLSKIPGFMIVPVSRDEVQDIFDRLPGNLL